MKVPSADLIIHWTSGSEMFDGIQNCSAHDCQNEPLRECLHCMMELSLPHNKFGKLGEICNEVT